MPPASHQPPSRVSTDESTETELVKGNVVKSSQTTWVIDELLGQGGFGAVYRVYEESNPSVNYAMKIEQKAETRPNSQLKMEIAILKLVASERAEKQSHFTKIKDRGKQEKFAFIVMQLVGHSLADMKGTLPNRVFSMATGIGVSIQCLEAVQDLHKFDFIHRDIKPANYACGLGQLRRTIYILDFGISRKLTNESNELKTPRTKVRFKGTVRFASLSCHRNLEMSYKDDCESWFYMLLDLLVVGGLPWRTSQEKDEVMRLKEDSREGKGQRMLKSFKAGREELWKVIDYIDHLVYTDRVDYSYIYSLLKLAAASNKVNLADPYDWEKVDKKPAEAKQANPYDARHDTVAEQKEAKPEPKAANKSAQRPVRPNK